MKKVIVISGPTGIGKTNLAISLAKKYDLEIINADASQMRKHMDIGTANILDSEVSGINTYLFKFLNPTDDFSIKDYQDLVRPIIDKVRLPLIVGGSGLYIDAALLDYKLDSAARDKSFDTGETDLQLYERLKQIDPTLASKTHPNNRKRVLRYLEIAGNVTSEATELYDILYITLDMDRPLLYERINNRFDKMINDGWIDEVKRLKEEGYDLTKVKEIGYTSLSDYLDGKVEFDLIKEKIKQETRNYAKRQLTWFRGSKKKYTKYYVFNPSEITKINELINKFIND